MNINKNLDDNMSTWYFYTAFIGILFFSILSLFQIYFIFKITNHLDTILPTSLLISFITTNIICKPHLKSWIILIIVFIIAGIYSYLLFDKAGDGRWYHQETIILIKNGWNPIFAPLDINTLKDNFSQSKTFPITSEVLSSSFAILFGHVQVGKIINILFCLYCFSVSYISLNKLFNITTKNNLIISAYLSLNPVVLSQIQSFYIDGNLFCTFIILLFSTLMWIFYDTEKRFWMFNIIVNFAILISLKFTGLAFAFIIITLPVISYTYMYHNLPKKFLQLSIFLIIAFIYFGWHPYIQNILAGRNILWPILGNHTNGVFLDVSQNIKINKFLLYILSYLSPYSMEANNLFIPTLKPFVRTDTSIGALGPFFGFILIINLYISFKYIFRNIKELRNNRNALIIVTITAVTIITIAINPGSWWIKYSPQIVFLPSIGLIVLSITNNKLWKKYTNYFIVMVIINSGLFYSGSFILTSYRSYKFDKMEQQCKLNQCIYDIHVFSTSLLNQLKEDHLDVKLGSCSNKNIIWKDIQINGEDTTKVCTDN